MKDLGKDPKTAPKTASYKRVAAMLTDEEGKKTKAQLEFICNVSPIFEDFLTIFQKNCPQVHIFYDKMSEVLRKLMGRFLKKEAYEKKFGSDLEVLTVVQTISYLIRIFQLEMQLRKP